ncbi:MAG: YigZ family protein [Desulfobacteraceae bacterium]|nr:YigZ family protein [Desulfobacteraceae bacterium]
MTENAEKYFYSIKDIRNFEIKIKRSTFICSLKYVETIKQAKEFISKISSEHKNATHNCWAYIVGDKGETSHCSDAGEPSGTAGQPMLNTLKSYETTSIAAVVTRHFGGVKLGIKGLINAYSESIQNTLELKKLIKLVKTEIFRITVPYSFNDILTYQLDKYSGTIINTDYSENVSYDFEVEQKKASDLEKYLLGLQNSSTLKYSKI